MNYFAAEGDEAKRLSEQSNTPGQKAKYVKLAAGESLRVKLLDPNFPSYWAHGDYATRIPTHLCTAPKAGMSCLSCDAGIKRSMKYLVPFLNVETGELEWFDAPKKHVSCVYSAIDAYGKEDVVDEIFELKRTGSGASDTTYSLLAVPPKKKGSIVIADTKVVAFEAGSQERSDMYNSVLRPASAEYMQKILAAANASAEITPASSDNDHNF